nr:hypothetical protein [uncultured Dyadobacter sp.]
MAFKGILAGSACITLLILFAVCFLLRWTNTPPHPNTSHIVAINKLLYQLRKECIAGQIDVAQNTVEDVKQEWSYLDVILRGQTFCPSDSLQTLDSLVRLMLNKDKSKCLLPIVLNEINLVNNRLDKAH